MTCWSSCEGTEDSCVELHGVLNKDGTQFTRDECRGCGSAPLFTVALNGLV
jgi:hypothetical protein